MATPILVGCSHGKEDPERATLPFIVGNVSATADQETIVFLTIEGVRVATKGYADGIQKKGMPPLKELWPPSSPTAARSGPAAPAPSRAASPTKT